MPRSSPITHPYWHRPDAGRLYDLAFRRVVRSGCTVIAVSGNTADTFRANFGSRPETVRTVHLYLPRSTTQSPVAEAVPRLAAPAPYFLFVGGLEARKNIVGAIEAFRLSRLVDKSYRLLIIGEPGPWHRGDRAERRQDRGGRAVRLGVRGGETRRLRRRDRVRVSLLPGGVRYSAA